MAQVVRSSRFDNGSEVSIKYTVYLSNSEAMALLCLLRKEFGKELPFTLAEHHMLQLHRMLDTLERSAL